MSFKHKHILGIEQMTKEDIQMNSFKEINSREIKKVPTLRGKTIINAFFEASTRTRLSFEIAGKRLSADTVNISGSTSSVVKGETLEDTAKNIEAMSPDIIVIRHGLEVAIVGDITHSRVARSDIYALSRMGAKVRLCGPGTMMPIGIELLGNVEVFTDICEAIEGADVVMMLRIQMERQSNILLPSLREYARFYGLNPTNLKLAKPDAIVMHPGPMNRGVEISSAVADGGQNVILDQVENGVATRMALLYLVSGVESMQTND
jgi:aspartate carbamoyltransferase catalytic subunit